MIKPYVKLIFDKVLDGFPLTSIEVFNLANQVIMDAVPMTLKVKVDIALGS